MKALAVLALLSLVLLAGCGSPSTGTTPPKDDQGRYVVEMTSASRFSPSAAKVPVGATVVWKHMGGAPHDVTTDDGSFGSGMMGGMSEGDEYAHTFNQTGTFPYFCHVHEGSGMKGTITVS